MKKQLFIGALAAAFALPLHAQSAQERLDARYDRALAAGYKALFLCSAIANAEANGATRTPESVHEWELTGVQAPLDAIIREMKYEIVRRPTGQIAHVQVEWADDMPDRVAAYYGPLTGCSILPIGAPEDVTQPDRPLERPPQPEIDDKVASNIEMRERMRERGLEGITGRFSDPADKRTKSVLPVLPRAFRSKTAPYGEGTRTTAVLVRQLGSDAAPEYQMELYGPDHNAITPQRTWSVAKSLASTFVGMAVQSGEFDVSEPIGLGYWEGGGKIDTRSAITLDHALRMATGRYSDTPGNRTDPIYWGGATIDENMTKWPMIHPPGTVYRYANNDTLLAIKAVQRYLDYYRPTDLLAKIGMTNTVVETDSRGQYVLSSQVWSTARDLANLGQLYLQNGVWNGERLLPENWRDYVSDPSGPQPEGTQWGYGAGWWTFKRPDFNSFEGVPDDAFAARGNRGQYVVVVPSRNVVIVRRGEDKVGTRFDIAAFTRDVLAALE
ncbi:MAG: serine hydrolase [Pseudomonadota bacterium]